LVTEGRQHRISETGIDRRRVRKGFSIELLSAIVMRMQETLHILEWLSKTKAALGAHPS
jgi:hypothetical protein